MAEIMVNEDLLLHSAEYDLISPVRTGDDWTHVRADIERLYIEENRTLKDVIQIMARDFGHRGSVKQYKHRIKIWGLRKNNQEHEALAVMRKKALRQRCGKASTFQMRGKTIDLEDLSRYFKRKRISNPEFDSLLKDIATPPDLTCWTPPSSSPRRSPLSESVELEYGVNTVEVRTGSTQQSEESPISDNTQQTVQAGSIVSNSIAIWEHVSHTIVPQSSSLTSFGAQTYHMRRSLSPPGDLLIQDSLFYHVKQYLHGAHCNGLFLQFEQSRLSLVKSIRGDGDLGRFANLWATGRMLMLDGDFIRGRRIFTRVSAMLHNIIKDADPSALSHIIEMHFHLHLKLPALADLLRCYSAEVAQNTYPEGHPWRVLLSALAKMDRQHLTEGLKNTWLLTNNELQKTVGAWDPAYISAITGYYTSGILEPLDMKSQLRALMHQGEAMLARTDERHLRLRCEYAWGLFHAGSFEDALCTSSNIILQAWAAGSKGFEIDCLRLSATCYHRLGNPTLAESTMRDAVSKLQACYGSLHPRGVRFMTTLQGWLQEWGKSQEARLFDTDIEVILGPDDV